MGRLRKKWRRRIPSGDKWRFTQKLRAKERFEQVGLAFIRPMAYPSGIDLMFDPDREAKQAQRVSEIDAHFDAIAIAREKRQLRRRLDHALCRPTPYQGGFLERMMGVAE
jgi:hypothetical protein